MHSLPKTQRFCWFSFCQVDEENSAEAVFMPVSVELTRAYGCSSSGKRGPKEAGFPMAPKAGYVGSRSLSRLLSVPSSRPACSAVPRPTTKGWLSSSGQGTAAGSSSAPLPRAESPRGEGRMWVCSQPSCGQGWDLAFQTEEGFKEKKPKAGRSLLALN